MLTESRRWATEAPVRDGFKFLEDDSFSTEKHCCKSCKDGGECDDARGPDTLASSLTFGIGEGQLGGRGAHDPIGPHDPGPGDPWIPPMNPDTGEPGGGKPGGPDIGYIPPPPPDKRTWRKARFGKIQDNRWWNKFLLANITDWHFDLQGQTHPTGEDFYVWDKMINPKRDFDGNVMGQCIVQLYCMPLKGLLAAWRHCYLLVMDCFGDLYLLEISRGARAVAFGDLAENDQLETTHRPIRTISQRGPASKPADAERKKDLARWLLDNYDNHIDTVYTDCLPGDFELGESPCQCLVDSASESRGFYFALGPNSNSFITDLLLDCDIPMGLPANAPGRSFGWPVGAYTRNGQLNLNAGGLLGVRGGLGVGFEILGLDTGVSFDDGFTVSLLGWSPW